MRPTSPELTTKLPVPDWEEVQRVLATTCRDLRTALGLSQQAVANGAKVSQGAISRLEAGAGAGLPLYSALKILGTLSLAAERVGLPNNPSAHALLEFTQQFQQRPPHAGAEVVLSADLVELLDTYHSLPAAVRPALVALVRAAANCCVVVPSLDIGLGPDCPPGLETTEQEKCDATSVSTQA